MEDKITPCIWIRTASGNINEVIEYYKNIFSINFVSEEIIPLGTTPSGNTQMCYVKIFNKRYLFMSTERVHFELNDGISFILECEDQNEIDLYWNYFIKEGNAVECGWCIDKYSLRWQVIPKNLDELMSTPEGYKILMNQKKIIIDEYLKNNR